MSCHQFLYYDNRNNHDGKLLASVIAESITIADKIAESNYQLNLIKSPFIGCRIEFDHCHSFSCPKESFSIYACKCEFIQAHIKRCISSIRRGQANMAVSIYRYIPLPAEPTKLVDLQPMLDEMKVMAATMVWKDEEDDAHPLTDAFEAAGKS